MRVSRELPLAVACLFACALAVTPAFAQAPPPPSPPSADEEEDEGPGDEIKEDEPTTPEGKAQKKEWEQKACPAADVKYDADTDKKSHPVPEPPEGKAMVFVIRPTRVGQKIQTKVAVDGEWKGANRGNNYLHFAVDPGQRFVCSKAENKSVLAFKAEAGKTYYLQQRIKMGIMKARNQVVLLSEEEGKKGLAKCHPSISSPKK